jgi:hypothetical protein
LRLPFRVEVDVGRVLLARVAVELVEDCEVGRERVDKVLRPDELEVVGGRVIAGKLVLGSPGENADRKIEARRAELTLVAA